MSRSYGAALVILAAAGWACDRVGERSLCSGQEPSGSSIRIASVDEPGTPMVIAGQVMVGKKRTPLAKARVIVYHTNEAGYYAKDGSGYPGAYLCGVLQTDSDGRYRIETIRPGPPANGNQWAHAHFEVTVPWGGRFHDAVSFEGGPRIGSVRAGESWEEVRPVVTGEDGVQNVEKDLWVRN